LRRDFPETFWWGTAASSPQTEGSAPASDWLAFERAGRVPPSGDGNGFGSRYADDFRLYADHGLTHHRLGIEWARIEPDEGERDAAAVEHYRAMLESARDAGIAPWVCLHHFVLPTWVAPGGAGFCDQRARDYFWRRHVEFVAETFGDLVFGWQPVNEPVVYGVNGFVSGVNPPGSSDMTIAMQAIEGAHLANLISWEILRETGKPVATVHALQPIFAADDSSETADAVNRVERIVWSSWIIAIREGVLRVPGREPIDVPAFRDAFDLIGFSYYNAFTVRAPLSLSSYPSDADVGPMGYAPWSEGIGLVLDRLATEFPDKPLLIAEHGIGTTDDAWRCRFLRESLDIVAGRLAAGIDIRGFFHWTGIDNYEWAQGWNIPFGLFDVNRDPKASAALMHEVATTRRVPVTERTG
jgi:beta-glucosidase